MRRFGSERTTLFFDPGAEPLAVVDPGEHFVVRTADSLCGLAKAEAPKGLDIDDVLDRLGGACPLAGPFAVRGARAGQVVAVQVHAVRPQPASGTAWTGILRGFGALSRDGYSLQEPLEPVTTLVAYDEEHARLPARGAHVAIPLHPFLGTLGVAPRRERRMSFSQSDEYLGDVDLPALTAGATVVLPVNIDGALLSLGDAHGAQGDGEITGAAIEIEAEVELSVDVWDVEAAGFTGLPQLNSAAALGSVAAQQGVALGENARAAYLDLVRRLVRSHGFTAGEAYQLLGQVGRLRVGNMIDPFCSALASVERRFL